MLAILNFIICTTGCFLVLFALINTNLSTEKWARLSTLCFIGLAFVDWLIFGMAFSRNLVGENIVGRGLALLATISFISTMRHCDKHHKD